MNIGAIHSDNGRCRFFVWAPFLKRVELRIVSPRKAVLPMVRDPNGYWSASIEDTTGALRYFYRLEGERDRPDPASRFQPEGVHGPSQTIDHAFPWEDAGWKGIPLPQMVMYELHAGTFTPEGTFDAIIPRLPALRDMGINAIEVMPVAQFPGNRNWGYDGAFPFAVQNSYGGPVALKRFVNACHSHHIAVILDVVYNHLGPEGNYLREYGPYFTDRYKTPWGMAINFDGPYSNEVRNYFIGNALAWIRDYHIDALRLDAIHGITDFSAEPFLRELADAVRTFASRERRRIFLVAESDLNDARILRPKRSGGLGISAQWCDDFHHSLHTLLTGETEGYYADFGKMEHMVRSVNEGFVYAGEYSAFRKRNHGSSSRDIPASQFTVFSQNHDQVGNRMLGERLSSLVSFESLKLAAAAVLFSPFIPLIFMGEEYGEDSPFLYFVSHRDTDLIEAVRKGRKEEFRSFTWQAEPPDPQDSSTFLTSKMSWEKRQRGKHRILLDLYKTMIYLRRTIPALSHLDKTCLHAEGSNEKKVLLVRRWKDDSEVYLLFNFHRRRDVRLTAFLNRAVWRKVLDTADVRWKGPGTLLSDWITGGKEIVIRKQSAALFVKESET